MRQEEGDNMSVYYLNYDIERLKEQRHGSYLVPEAFKNSVRLELKWAYTALLNLLLDEAEYSAANEAYLCKDLNKMSQALAKLTNKKVDQDKMQNYLDELETADLVDLAEDKCYLKRII